MAMGGRPTASCCRARLAAVANQMWRPSGRRHHPRGGGSTRNDGVAHERGVCPHGSGTNGGAYAGKGSTNKEIACELSISISTVKTRMKHIMARTKCSTRTGILAQVLCPSRCVGSDYIMPELTDNQRLARMAHGPPSIVESSSAALLEH